MNQFFKRLTKTRWAAAFASALVSIYIRLIYSTIRWRYRGRERLEGLDPAKGVILAFWHSRLLIGAIIRHETEKRIFMLISAHRDGEIIAKAVHPFGVDAIRGSAANPKKKFKDKSGAPAIVQMIGALDEGHMVGLTPDGPRGPRQSAKLGIIRLAQMSGAPILPVSYSSSVGFKLSTWDRFFLAWPFSKGVFTVGEPISVPADADPQAREKLRLALEIALNEATDDADIEAGRSPDRSPNHNNGRSPGNPQTR